MFAPVDIEIGGSGAEWAKAFAPVIPAAVAVWIALRVEGKERRRQPALALSSSPDNPLELVTNVETSSHGMVQHYLRIRVENAREKRSADDVEVFVIGVTKAGEERRALSAVPLVWSNSAEPGAGGAPFKTKGVLPPGVHRYVDAISITSPGGRMASAARGLDCPAELNVYPRAYSPWAVLDAGRYEIDLAVAARDADAQFYLATFEWDGKWWLGAEAREHLEWSLEPRSGPPVG